MGAACGAGQVEKTDPKIGHDLVSASEKGDVAEVCRLLNMKANINSKDKVSPPGPLWKGVR